MVLLPLDHDSLLSLLEDIRVESLLLSALSTEIPNGDLRIKRDEELLHLVDLVPNLLIIDIVNFKFLRVAVNLSNICKALGDLDVLEFLQDCSFLGEECSSKPLDIGIHLELNIDALFVNELHVDGVLSTLRSNYFLKLVFSVYKLQENVNKVVGDFFIGDFE